MRQQQAFSKAVNLYRRALNLEGTDTRTWYNLAHCLDENGELQDAIGALQRAVELDGHFADAIFNLARCYERLHQHEKAIPYWNRYLQLDSKSEWSKIARRFLHYG